MMDIKNQISIVRDSNMELLRIVAMFFILCHHFICNSLYSFQEEIQNGLTAEYATYSLLEGLFYVGVNCFLLISGYYGIKLRARKIWTMYLQLGFYGGTCYLFEVLLYHKPITHTLLTKSLLIFSHPCWWFVAYFLLLMFLSPWINYGIKQMSKMQYLVALLGMTFVQVYLGWFWQKTCYDPNGYSILNFLYVYLIGGYIGRFINEENLIHHRWLILGIYICCAIVWGLWNILRHYVDIPFGNNYGYNNPVVLCGAISFFLFFLSLSFKSKTVNWLASGVFAVYLITDTPYVGNPLYTAYDKWIHSLNMPFYYIIGLTLGVAILILMSSCVLDRARAWLMKPILPSFDWLDKKIKDQ